MRDYSSDSDIWDRVNGKIVLRRYAAQQQDVKPPKPIMEWPTYYPPYPPRNPTPPGASRGDRARLGGPVRPRPKPTDEERNQGPVSPKPKPRRGAQGAADPYSDPKARQDLMRGAYQAGLNGDAGAASSFPRGSAFDREYQRGLRDRAMRKNSMDRYRPDAG